MAGGGTIWFAAPYTAGPQHELALVAQVRYDGQQTTEIQGWRTEWMVQVQFRSALGRLRTAVASWYQTPALSGGPGTISVWNSARGGLVTCALPGTPGFWARLSPDGQRVLYQAIPDVDPLTFEPRSGPLLLVNPASADEAGACHLVAEGGVIHADLSPDGASMLWLERPTPAAETALWVAAVDRSAPRRVAAGVFSEALFRDGQRLELLIGGDLVWIDLATDPPEEHPIAERVFGYNPEGYRLTAELWPDLSSAWQVIGYGFSAQDGTGTLGLVNRDTGVARSISPSVAWGYGVYDVARSQRVLYLVRGRTPSAQDGLWLATIHPEDRR
jgi:hypothetical protein